MILVLRWFETAERNQCQCVTGITRYFTHDYVFPNIQAKILSWLLVWGNCIVISVQIWGPVQFSRMKEMLRWKKDHRLDSIAVVVSLSSSLQRMWQCSCSTVSPAMHDILCQEILGVGSRFCSKLKSEAPLFGRDGDAEMEVWKKSHRTCHAYHSAPGGRWNWWSFSLKAQIWGPPFKSDCQICPPTFSLSATVMLR